MKKFDVIAAHTLEALIERVNEAMEQGYTPLGSGYTYYEGVKQILAQNVVLKDAI